jgi:hypothetical protein
MKLFNKVLLVTLTMTSLHSFADSGASKHGSEASKHSALATAHGLNASAKVGSAVIATPLIVAGAVGHISLEAGKALMENAVDCEPLEITEKTITTAPSPLEAMKLRKQERL